MEHIEADLLSGDEDKQVRVLARLWREHPAVLTAYEADLARKVDECGRLEQLLRLVRRAKRISEET